MPNTDSCDCCESRRELYHNDKTGLSLCEKCDRFVDLNFDESDREQRLENFLKSALASMEMRHERGFNLMVPLPWINGVHLAIYGEEDGPKVMETRIHWARHRKERRELEDAG